MLTRITVPLLAAAVLIFACGPRAHPTAANARTTVTTSTGVVSRLNVDAKTGDVEFTLAVANETPKRVELSFPDGRTHDFFVLDNSGREVWRWSTGRMFTQAMQNRLLDSRDSVVYNEKWNAPPGSGRYTLVARLNSENYPVEKRIDFSLP